MTKEADTFYQEIIDRLIYTSIGCFCRLFPPSAPTDPTYRRNAVRTVANYFKKENQFIFWIDGPNAEALAKEFKSISPGLVVAAPGADMSILDSFSDNTPDVNLLSQLFLIYPKNRTINISC